MNIVFITSNYPTETRYANGTFVKQFVLAMHKKGHICTVINPVSYFEKRYGELPSQYRCEEVDGRYISIYHPRFVSCSAKKLGVLNTGIITSELFTAAVVRAFEKYNISTELIYGHFLYASGYAAIRLGKIYKVPSVVGVGEGEFWTIDMVGDKKAKKDMEGATAFLALSNYIADELGTRLSILRKKIRVFPNGVNLDSFRPQEKFLTCQRKKIPNDTFNIGYIGSLARSKGYPQLKESILGIHDVRLVLLGRGIGLIHDKQIAFSGTVPHKEVSDYLATCDIFVLPTMMEGSCNSVIEAMACGLPIITSDGYYMDDIVDDEVAIRVDPNNVRAIREAILILKEDTERRRRMSEACLKKAKKLDINNRAKRISNWMSDLVNWRER